jgi:DNA-binding MarR family transcriptional regulator
VSKQEDRQALVEAVATAAADFGAAAGVVDAAVAAALGVNATDLRILAAVHRDGRLTASEAAAAARLSLSATTTALQRLVRGGLLLRGHDPGDHRRVVLTLTARAAQVVEDSYGPLGREGLAYLASWTGAELEVIRRFLLDGVAFQHRHADRVRRAAGS